MKVVCRPKPGCRTEKFIYSSPSKSRSRTHILMNEDSLEPPKDQVLQA